MNKPLQSTCKGCEAQCPVCGYYCLGKKSPAIGCIDKPNLPDHTCHSLQEGKQFKEPTPITFQTKTTPQEGQSDEPKWLKHRDEGGLVIEHFDDGTIQINPFDVKDLIKDERTKLLSASYSVGVRR